MKDNINCGSTQNFSKYIQDAAYQFLSKSAKYCGSYDEKILVFF